MKTNPFARSAWYAAALCAAWGGHVALGAPQDARGAPGRHEPATIWEYLADRYDADGDGRILREEYPRSEEKFRRLDRDGDGVLTRDDFARRARGMRDARAIAGAVLARYVFAEPERLDRRALAAAFAKADSDKDRTLSREEFDSLVPERVRGRMDRFRFLLEALDRDADGAIGLDELEAWFEVADRDGDGVLAGAEMPSAGGRRGRGERPGRPEPLARVGEPAPDFTLKPPDGGEPVTLSSFAGKKPVALIFGSYT